MLVLVNYNSYKLAFLLDIIVNIVNIVNCSAIGCTEGSDIPSQEGTRWGM